MSSVVFCLYVSICYLCFNSFYIVRATHVEPGLPVWQTQSESAFHYLKESLSSILCFIIQGKGSSWKRFDPEILVCCNIAHI